MERLERLNLPRGDFGHGVWMSTGAEHCHEMIYEWYSGDGKIWYTCNGVTFSDDEFDDDEEEEESDNSGSRGGRQNQNQNDDGPPDLLDESAAAERVLLPSDLAGHFHGYSSMDPATDHAMVLDYCIAYPHLLGYLKGLMEGDLAKTTGLVPVVPARAMEEISAYLIGRSSAAAADSSCGQRPVRSINVPNESSSVSAVIPCNLALTLNLQSPEQIAIIDYCRTQAIQEEPQVLEFERQSQQEDQHYVNRNEMEMEMEGWSEERSV